jgi:DNA modification methylase
MQRLLALVSAEDDLVVDPFSGNGSVAVAALNTGRNFIGFEIDKEYFDLSNKRIETAANDSAVEGICVLNRGNKIVTIERKNFGDLIYDDFDRE